MSELQITYRSVDELVPYARNARTHSEQQIDRLAASIREYGWTNPILTDGESGQAYIELTSCNRDKAEAFREQLNTRLWPQLEEYREDETENRTRPCQS